MHQKYPLGFALIQWKGGSHSEAVIFQDKVGNQCIQCANWLYTPNVVPYLSNFIDEIENIVTDIDDIAMIMQWGD
ncbi:MAG: hypothetical protein [Enterobacter phage ENC9]|uniref:hypothetical protein n=1 Tax=Enterobacter phage vB_EclM_Q7622 TaxID=2908628 RepID=UPI0023290D50|nr:hypothetical protein PP425_gp295 [Enterobacter phage vB_EclM_Q7622]UIS65672.1 hypothetical protein Q76222_00162 [Enterobacter phage vB_EclM_Q7622]UIW11182.1 MAG: hypothetical protein [Enterobacter phage ENC9]